MLQEEVPGAAELFQMHEIRCRLDQAVAGSELFAEFGEAGSRLDALVREIGFEIVEGLFRAARSEEDDLDAVRGGLALGDGALLIEADQFDCLQPAAGARKEYVKDGKGAAELVLLQIHFHVLGNEKGEAQDGVERFPEIGESRGQGVFGHAGDVGNGAGGFEAGEDVSGGVGKERLGVKDVRSAEEVEQRAFARVGISEEVRSPGADFRELARFQFLPRLVEFRGVIDPGGIVTDRGERRVANGKAGEKERVVIGRGGFLGGEMPEEAGGQ